MMQPTFDIVIDYTGNQRYSAYFTSAALFWELAITGDVPDASISGIGPVDDLYITASVVSIDGVGGILGQAGPDYYRNGPFLPISGVMQFDISDCESLIAADLFSNVILHEMGHVLGLGTVWDLNGSVLQTADLSKPTGYDYSYVETSALTEYRVLANNSAATQIAVESTLGGAGTIGGHWDETIFGNELMTGFVANGYNPISRMTLAALRDTGYDVDLGVADPYWLASTLVQHRDDFAGSFRTTGILQIGQVTSGKIELAEDNDWLAVNLIAGSTYSFSLKGSPTGSGTLADGLLTLHAVDGQILAANDNAGGSTDAELVFTAVASGTYYLDAASADDLGIGTYSLSGLMVGGAASPFSETSDTVTLSTPGLTWNALGGNDTVNGSSGADSINGNSGNDLIFGGAGDDHLVGGSGIDLLIGEGGSDWIYSGNDGTVNGGGMFGGAGSDHLIGGAGADNMVGGTDSDVIEGNFGNDFLYGQEGNDQMNGGQGVDVLLGGAGDDQMRGGGGIDYLFCDSGNDAIIFEHIGSTANQNINVIYGFDSGSSFDAVTIKGFGTQYDTFQEVMNSAQYYPGLNTTIITLLHTGGIVTDSLWLVGIERSQLRGSDFLFGS
jgi:Ca2+-binding RTX toxin-like protein